MSNSASAGMRIENLLDPGSFIEIGGHVTARNTDFNLPEKETPADGVVTGYGTIDGSLVYVYSQDSGVLGGSVGEMHAKKIVHLYQMAMKMGAPVIGMIDCAGMRLQEATDALNAFGELYLCQVNASGVIPQITAVFGNCGGGMALVPALSDFVFMEAEKARMFVNAPNTLEDGAGKDTASALFQSEKAGAVDRVGSEEEILKSIRTLISILPANNEDDMSYDECEDDLNRVCEGIEGCIQDGAAALSMISDDGFFYEVKEGFAKNIVTGFIRLNGVTVGAVANRTERHDEEGNAAETFEPRLTSNGCMKAAEFISFCDAFSIPVLTLVQAEGMKADFHQELRIAKSMGKMTCAYAGATVPKVTVIVGKAYGTAYTVMNSKGIGADLVYAWPDTAVGMMDAESAARIIYAEEIRQAENAPALIGEKAAEYAALQGSPLSAARRGYIDHIIQPGDTRKYVIGAFEMLFTKREDRPSKKHGTV